MVTVMRRFCAAALAAVLLLCAAPLSPAARAAFADAGGSWAAEVIQKAEDYGLMEGYPDGTFGVGKALTRGEFVAVLCRMFGWEAAAPASPSFSDCPATHWTYSYVETALAHGVMDAGGAFRPEDPISREEMAVMLVRALGYHQLAGQLTGLSLPFDDVTDNRGHIAIAYDIGMITGVAGADGSLKFLPRDSATREEAAAMLVRVYERYTSRVDWLHGFYAISAYSQLDLTGAMDAVSVGWARMECDPAAGPLVNTTSANGNGWTVPAGAAEATGYWESRGIPYNLNVYASDGDSITLADGTVCSTVDAVVGDPARRAQAVAALVDAAADYAGLTLDFEGLKGGDTKANYPALLAELRAALPADKTLWVCVQPDTWYDGWDYRAIGEAADKVILMAHDYQWTSVPQSYVGTANTNSPVTPFDQVYQALRDLTDPASGVADRSKLALAVSFGTAGFRVDGDGNLLETTIYHPAMDTLAARLNQSDTVVTYDTASRNPYALYTTEDGSRYKVWYENEQSVVDKIQLARMFGVNGLSLWRVGNIPHTPGYDVWSAILTQR